MRIAALIIVSTILQPAMAQAPIPAMPEICRTSPINYRLPECEPFFAKNRPNRNFKSIDPDDVRNTPGKWAGRDIEFASVQVYWVDDNDVRLLTHSALTVFAKSLTGSLADVAHFRANCETAKESNLPSCRARLRFSYSRHSEDMPTGLRKRTVIVTDNAELIRQGPRHR